ncbi:response regulator transcription factor [Alicyclobacillus acidocaldarius]|uniref:Two component transcriptional regulator, LuxR family n=1 Tax=Alicyclobacillus acidocaldarius (strain Tc-4-1) TaxID=1048834 RepID=F8ICJ9_ALIAT|nr:response regulator transcription factor [Alicyclobacillus acidocaldarius]AEJ42475.1 two component transcriptional regulator, LuxR family [Alicyclobacillus acidocaldarius subsp. acidocaldarius Tc-4-1]
MVHTRVVIVDDHALVRHGLRLILHGVAGIEVVGECSCGEEALKAAVKERPDVMLMDVHMPHGLDGITTARHLRQIAPEVRVIMLTMFDDRAHVEKMLDAKVAGIVFKHDDSQEIVEAIRRGRAECPYISRRWNGNREAKGEAHGRGRDDVRLSPREAEVLVLVARGYTNREIADALHISVKTVETHRQHIAQRLGATSRGALIRYAYESGLVDPPVPGGVKGTDS